VLINQEYYANCLNKGEIAIPAFAKINKNCLFLSEFRISDCMAEALKAFLQSAKGNPKRQVKKLFIDDCGMQD